MKQFFLALALGLALCLPVLAVAVPASAHTLAHSIPAKCPRLHLKAHPSHLIDEGTVPVFSVIEGCHLNRNDTYDVITSDPCVSALPTKTVVADNEGRVNFVVMFDTAVGGTCDPDFYVITLRDQANNHMKAYVVITLRSA